MSKRKAAEAAGQAFYKDVSGKYHPLTFSKTPWYWTYVGVGLMCLGAWGIGFVGGLFIKVIVAP
jgi:hypothetical protein